MIHVYTGNGKGKTTAAFGLALRAACAGKKVFIGQFVKGMEYSELKVPEYIPNIKVEQFGRNCFIFNNPTKEDIDAAKNGLKRLYEIANNYDVIILDEVNVAVYYRLLSVEEILNFLNKLDKSKEVILTGRYAPQEFVDIADLVTEMKEVKHYYKKGVKARKGIEF
ncbi:cobinamide adenolsyltransferase [Thermosipho melanesiensis]|uniref:Cob(I)alamin adenosyltransferase n=2 Tax=Thermosipho melanesiensis TaxID=46541 RepID=A6LLC1_THEM4|nr:cob(I)yrinic acid a,c-diamide adenosyltransferase [Thermosipho melanesiensis]ABR30722.1 cob(I)alamin adenosyltransferase [Thermosipho melanesiensis BI429]OOC35791.1 cobinamide adenolsyltransferase [Thermosipho melanesiensis]OOC38293.1 cobinamide adenolsyltransferase [Thermosipho melanesiensis]OOC38754.1 cobinamide adenolsyltransferase [Thermosipho melanesiensis]OOC41393.1 cobinamide adenolsyltransferase [Thermosipho melanesiensis]